MEKTDGVPDSFNFKNWSRSCIICIVAPKLALSEILYFRIRSQWFGRLLLHVILKSKALEKRYETGSSIQYAREMPNTQLSYSLLIEIALRFETNSVPELITFEL